MLIISSLLVLLFLMPQAASFASSLERLNVMKGKTSLEVVAVTGLSGESPYVYIRNLGPRSLSLGSSAKPRDPNLWQVFINEEMCQVIEVQELEKEDNVLEIDEILRLKIEVKEAIGSKVEVRVFGPGATSAQYINNRP